MKKWLFVFLVYVSALHGANVTEVASQIKVLILSVDGVLSDGKLIYSSLGGESKIFCAEDINALLALQKNGVYISVVTSDNGSVIQQMTSLIQFDDLMANVIQSNKLSTITNIANMHGATLPQVAYMSKDAQDVSILQAMGLAACPQNADQQVKAVCAFVATKNGGDGAVKELCNVLVQAGASGQN